MNFNEAGATMAPETSDRQQAMAAPPRTSMRPGQQWPRKHPDTTRAAEMLWQLQ